MQRTVIESLVGVRTVTTLLLGLAMGAGLALADHSDTPLGESEIVSKRFDGPLTSRALNGDSQLEDLSADGRYVAFNTEGSVTSATRSEPKSLVYDRLTEEVTLFDPAPGARTGNLMFSDNGGVITFLSDSIDLGGDPIEDTGSIGNDLFRYDRATDAYSRLTSGYDFRLNPEREGQVSADGSVFLLRNDSIGSNPAGYYTVESTTGEVTRVLGTEASRVVLSADGSTLAYYQFVTPGSVWRLRWLNLNTGESRDIETETSFELVSISSDGLRIAYPKRLSNSLQALFVYDVSAASTTRLFPQADGNLRRAVFSGDDQHLLIESTATNLTGTFDPNGNGVDLFDYEFSSGNTTRISRLKPNGISIFSSNEDASVIAFEDDANVFDADDPNGGYSDVFVWSRQSGDIVRASNAQSSYDLIGGNEDSSNPQISGSGRYVTFLSDASNLVEGDTNNNEDVFYYDRHTGELSNLTLGANTDSEPAEMSATGQVLAFLSRASNLESGDDAGSLDVFVYYNAGRDIDNLTVGPTPYTIDASRPLRMSSDGRTVVFNTFSGLKQMELSTAAVQDLPFDRVLDYDLSADGRLIVVNSGSPADWNIEVYDTALNQVVDSLGLGSSNSLIYPKMSDDGRYIVLYSRKDLNAGDTLRDTGGVYLWDRALGVTTHIAASEQFGEAFNISADGTKVVFESTDSLLPNVDPSGAGCALQPSGYAYDVSTGNITHLGCVTQDAPGTARTVLGVSGNGDFLVGGIRGWYVQTDIDARDNVFVQRVGGGGDTNTPPVALEQSVTVNTDSSIAISLRGTDEDGDGLTYQLQDLPTNGALVGDAPDLEYTPNSGYAGTDSFTFTVNDGQASSSVAVVSISVVEGSSQTFTGTQRPGTRIIDLSATWPAEAAWTQVREFDGPSNVLWDGLARSWTGSYTVPPGVNSVRFDSRWWIGNTVTGNIEIVVQLGDDPGTEQTLTGFAWIDSNSNALRDPDEAAEVGRAVDVYRCGPPWGVAGRGRTVAPDGSYRITGLAPGEYQIGTRAIGVEFTNPGGDSVIYPSGFSNCVLIDGTQPELGIGILSADAPRITISGTAWFDVDGNSVRDDSEAGDPGRTLTAYRCGPPWGVVGEAVTNPNGDFALFNVQPGVYQFGTSAENVGFSPVARDNLFWESGFTSCIDFSADNRSVGMGIVPQ